MLEHLSWPSLIGGILSIIAFIPYIASILRKETRPHLVTWSMWSILGALLAASYYSVGATSSAIVVPIIYVIGPIVVTLLALKYGEYGYNFFDLSCCIAAVAALAGWILTGNPILALYISLVVDLCGALPTLKKVAFFPNSEDMTAWVLFLMANAVNLWTIPGYEIELIIYPLYLFLMPLLITGLMLRRYQLFKLLRIQ